MMDLQALEDFCMDRAGPLRPLRNDVRWLIHLAAQQLPTGVVPEDEDQRSAVRKRMQAVLGTEIRHRCGNPLVAWVFLNVILPMVIKAVIEWWQNKHKE